MKNLIVYGSTTGNTENAARLIAEKLGDTSKVVSVASVSQADIDECDLLILGASTWGFGELQDDWIDCPLLTTLNLNGKKVALFGLGDQTGFSDTFVDAMGIIKESLSGQDIQYVGEWSTSGYDYSGSTAVEGENFVGLALDEENQGDMTSERIALWSSMLKEQLK